MRLVKTVMWTTMVGSLALALPAFAQADTTTGGNTGGEMGNSNNAAGSKATAGALTDPQIAAIVLEANQADIDAAKLAKSHAKDKAVKQFAQTMIRDHEASNKQAKKLASQLHLKPEQNPTSMSMKDGAKSNMESLKKMKGAAFDKAYIDHEVDFHQQVLSAINDQLIPNAKNAELKSLLEKTAPVIQGHLEHAKTLQQKITGVGGAGQQ